MRKSHVGLIAHLLLIAVLILSNWANPAAAEKRIKVDVTTHLGDVKDFQEGDKLAFLVSSDRDAYLLVIYVDAGGGIYQVLPNKRQQDNFYKAGLFIAIPAADAGFSFMVQPPFGQETLSVYASATPLPQLDGRYLDNGLRKLNGNIQQIRKYIINSASSGYGEASLQLQTRDRK